MNKIAYLTGYLEKEATLSEHLGEVALSRTNKEMLNAERLRDQGFYDSTVSNIKEGVSDIFNPEVPFFLFTKAQRARYDKVINKRREANRAIKKERLKKELAKINK